MTISNVKDPLIYPVTFSLARRELAVVDNMTATTTFMAYEGKTLRNAHYFYDGIYIIDVDYTSSDSITFVGNGKRLILEFTSDSTTLSSCHFNVKAWVNESSFKLFGNKGVFTFRQAPWGFATTESSFYASSNMKQFLPVSVSGVPYYPSVSSNISFYPDYYLGKTITPCSVDPGVTVTKDVINVGDHGVLTMSCSLSVSWFYDEARTLPVGIPPSELDGQMSPQTFVSRVAFVAPGKFYFMGGMSSDGLAVFDGILTQNYVLSNSLNYGSLTYIGLNDITDALYVDQEVEVIIDDNGYCVKEGRVNQVYFLGIAPSSSSSSSSSSLAGGSSSCSCSFSSSSCSCSSSSSCSCSSSSSSCSCSCSSSCSSSFSSSSSSYLSWSPLDISGLTLWLDANNSSTLWQNAAKTIPAVNTNDVIAEWSDLSTNSNHAKQPTTGSQPLLKLSAINALPVIKFDGYNDLLTIAHNSGLNLNAMTILIVGTPVGYPSDSGNNVLVMKNGNASSNPSIYGFMHYQNPIRKQKYGICVNATGGWTDNASSSLLTIGVSYLLTAKYDGSTTLSQRKNGTPDGTLGKTGTVATSSGTLQIGGYNSSWSYQEHSNWEIGEILIYNSALSSDDTLLVEAYLRAKWGIV